MRREKPPHQNDPIPEQPNWNIVSLYTDRQLICNDHKTKFFIPFDSTEPDQGWRLFLFHDNTDEEQMLPLEQSTYLIGREKYCDVCLSQMSVSRQHCAIQFRRPKSDEENSNTIDAVPYIFDINSKYGTFVNDEKIPSSCFYQLFHEDKIRFGNCPVSAILLSLKPQ